MTAKTSDIRIGNETFRVTDLGDGWYEYWDVVRVLVQVVRRNEVRLWCDVVGDCPTTDDDMEVLTPRTEGRDREAFLQLAALEHYCFDCELRVDPALPCPECHSTRTIPSATGH